MANRQQIKNEVDKINSQLTESNEVNTIRLFGSIANSIDNLIPDNAKGPDRISKVALRNILKLSNDQFYKIIFGNKKAGNKANKVGALNFLNLLTSIDLCDVLAPLDSVGTKKFNPNANPVPTNPMWKVQLLAYSIKQSINQYNAISGQLTDPQVRRGRINVLLGGLLTQMQTLGSADYLAKSEFKQQYPSSTIALNTVNEFSQYILKEQQSPEGFQDIDKINNKLNLLTKACDAIIGFGSPEQLKKFSDKFAPEGLTDAIRRLDEILKPGENVINVLRNIIDNLGIVQRTASMILNIVSLLQIVITILKVVVKILKIVGQFLGIIPVPNLYTTLGITNTVGEVKKNISVKANDLVYQLQNVSNVLTIISLNIESVLAILDLLIPRLANLIEKLESCNRGEDDYDEFTGQSNNGQSGQLQSKPDRLLLGQLKERLEGLTNVQTEFRTFLTNYENNKTKSINKYGDYTIEIVEEKLVDEGISIRRRYGVALDRNLIEVVKTEPTFASDDNVIREDVKLRIRSLKQENNNTLLKEGDLQNINVNDLANISESLFGIEQQNIINEASNWLYDDTTSIDDINIDTTMNTYIDAPDNEDDNDGLGLNAFINKLKGGKKIRRKVREAMDKEKAKLQENLDREK